MIIKESKLVYGTYYDGYYITIDDIVRIVRDFQVDCFDGFVSNDKSYIESWLLKNLTQIK